MSALWGFVWKWAVLAGLAYTVFRLVAANNSRGERRWRAEQDRLDRAFRQAAARERIERELGDAPWRRVS